MRELTWVPAGCSLVKVPLVLKRIAALDAAIGRGPSAPRDLAASSPRVVYAAGGQQALVAWPAERSLDELDRTLEGLALSGLVVRGLSGRRRLGSRPSEAAIERVRLALDPRCLFREP
jgi:hypothetical protein